MKNIDISILKEKPSLDTEANLIIEPLAPISMVSELPGSYYKSLMYPSKKMMCGLFENILGWHFDTDSRTAIIKDLQKTRKKQKIDVNYKMFSHGSTFIPLLMEYFDILEKPQIKDFKSLCKFDDYWSKLYKRSDENEKHPNGVRYMDANTIKSYVASYIGFENSEAKKNKARFYKAHTDKFPQYYVSPAIREFIDLDGSFSYKISMDSKLFTLLSFVYTTNNLCYLGNNEGWVNITLTRI